MRSPGCCNGTCSNCLNHSRLMAFPPWHRLLQILGREFLAPNLALDPVENFKAFSSWLQRFAAAPGDEFVWSDLNAPVLKRHCRQVQVAPTSRGEEVPRQIIRM